MAKTIILIALALFASAQFEEEDDVLVLTDANIDEALSTYTDLLVEFYAPWCGHCKQLAPEYAKAAKTLKNRDPPIRIAKVDATENNQSASKYGVSGYPTLKFFTAGTPSDYTGGRTEDAIVSWVLKKVGPASEQVEQADDLQQKIDANEVVAVLFTDKGSVAEKEYETAARQLEDITFVTFTNAEQFMQFDAKNPGLILFKKFDDRKNVYAGAFTSSAIKAWLEVNSLPSVLEFNDKAIDHIFRNGNPALFVFRSDSDAEKLDQIESAVAAELKSEIAFVKVDLNAPENGRLAEYLGVSANDQPLAFIADTRNQSLKKFKFTEELTESSLKKLVEDWQKGSLKTFLKTQEVPAEAFDNDVRVLVGKNFEEVVFDTTKDVFVEFYAPWCGHCKKLAPDYEKVAGMFKDVESVVVAKIDATANEVEGQDIRGFPTLKFFPANDKKGKNFDGDRSAEGIAEYIKNNSAVKIDEAVIRSEL